MAGHIADLKELQDRIKRDPDGYKQEFLLQFRHFHTLLEIFKLKPNDDAKSFERLVDFIAHVASCFPDETSDFAQDMINLMDEHYNVLDSSLRRTICQSLILMRNRGSLSATALLPLFFRLFDCSDKRLRQLCYKHIVIDVQNCNKKHRDERLNRNIQNFLFGQLQNAEEMRAKKSVAVLIELYRRLVWTDARTVNIIATACFHSSHSVLVSALKFFLGQDEKDTGAGDEEESESEDEGGRAKTVSSGTVLSKEDVYKAYSKGVASSKKAKQRKLKRIVQKAKRDASNAEKGARANGNFAALQLLNDPQGFAEKLFSRLSKGGNHVFETKMMILGVTSRVIGTHQLQLLNFYPYMQKYLMPHQRDVTKLLAVAVQACHELVPPETLDPLLRQVVNQFVHDRARPEVIAIGLQTVREVCTRAPLVMTEELLQDLTEYSKDRDRGVRMSARSLITLFRDLAPGLLTKKNRGKGHDQAKALHAFGSAHVATRIDGAELLQDELENPQDSDDGDSEGSEGGDSEAGSDLEEEGEEGDLEHGEEEEEDDDEEEEEGEDSEEEVEEEGAPEAKRARTEAQEGSLRSLKRQQKEQKEASERRDAAGAASSTFIEHDRLLSQADFKRIKALQAERAMEGAMGRAGGKKTQKLAQDSLAAMQAKRMALARSALSETRVNPHDLEGEHKRKRALKEERLASVLEGREGRTFGAAAMRKKAKTGGKSNAEKSKAKKLPLAARLDKGKRDKGKKQRFSAVAGKQFKGSKAYKV